MGPYCFQKALHGKEAQSCGDVLELVGLAQKANQRRDGMRLSTSTEGNSHVHAIVYLSSRLRGLAKGILQFPSRIQVCFCVFLPRSSPFFLPSDKLMSTWSAALRGLDGPFPWNWGFLPVNWTGWARIVVATLDTERRARRTERFLAFRRAMSSKRISGSWGRLVSRRLYMERRHSRAGMFLSWWAWHKKCIKDEMEWV